MARLCSVQQTAAGNSKEWPQILAVLSAAISVFNAGSLFAWTSPAIPKLLSDEYKIEIEDASYLTVIPPISMIIASPIYCRLLDAIGRKRTLLISAVTHVAAWLLIAFAGNIWIFYASRVLSGTADACIFATLPIYIAEVTTPKVRGVWGNSLMLGLFSGQFVINTVGYFFSIRACAFIMTSFPVLFFLVFSFMPESPYYCIKKNQMETAGKSLRWLRGCQNVEQELQQLARDVERQMSESGKLKDLFIIESNRKAVFIANLVRTSQQFGGISALAVYTQYIFLQAGGNISSGYAAMLFSGALALTNTFANVISDKLGRCKSMVISCAGCGVVLLGEAAYFYLLEYTEVDLTYGRWFPVAGLFLYVIIFTIGLGVVPTLLLGELFSMSIRSHASLVANIVFGVLTSVVTKLFQLLMTSFGLCVPFLFFSVCCFLSTITSYYFVPETKGKTLEEIQQMLKGREKTTVKNDGHQVQIACSRT